MSGDTKYNTTYPVMNPQNPKVAFAHFNKSRKEKFIIPNADTTK